MIFEPGSCSGTNALSTQSRTQQAVEAIAQQSHQSETVKRVIRHLCVKLASIIGRLKIKLTATPT